MRRRALPRQGPLLMSRAAMEPVIDTSSRAVAHHVYGDGTFAPAVARTLRGPQVTTQDLAEWDADRDLVMSLLCARHRAPAATERASWWRGIKWCEHWLKWDAMRERVLLINSQIELFDARYRLRQANPLMASVLPESAGWGQSCSDPGVQSSRTWLIRGVGRLGSGNSRTLAVVRPRCCRGCG